MSRTEKAQFLKKQVLGRYVQFLDSIDPEVADHILEGQKHLFLAFESFFREEAGHAEKAQKKIRKKYEN